jgi:hypothetical protein
MVVLVSIVCTGVAIGLIFGIGRLLRYMRERDERDDARLKMLEGFNSDIYTIINGKENSSGDPSGDH